MDVELMARVSLALTDVVTLEMDLFPGPEVMRDENARLVDRLEAIEGWVSGIGRLVDAYGVVVRDLSATDEPGAEEVLVQSRQRRDFLMEHVAKLEAALLDLRERGAE